MTFTSEQKSAWNRLVIFVIFDLVFFFGIFFQYTNRLHYSLWQIWKEDMLHESFLLTGFFLHLCFKETHTHTCTAVHTNIHTEYYRSVYNTYIISCLIPPSFYYKASKVMTSGYFQFLLAMTYTLLMNVYIAISGFRH